MFYISTRGDNQPLTFSEVVLKGLAPDGGLYVPAKPPVLSDDLLRRGHELSLIDFAVELLSPFIADDKIVGRDDLRKFLAASLALFADQTEKSWPPLYKNIWLLELFHGPTLSFKDVAMQFLGQLFDHILTRLDKKITIVAATSGDTGSAAIHAFRRVKRAQVVVFHPAGKVSQFQQKQMTTVQDDNIHNIAIRGSFDDCQDMVKQLFATPDLATRYGFSAVNSINWARVMMQMVYHARAAVMLHHQTKQAINIAVPSGNFGNMLAGYYVRQMGFPVDKLLVATNENDILYRFFNDNNMTVAQVKQTHSPSMDIQISSNLERYLYELFGRDAAVLKEKMITFRKTGKLLLSPEIYKKAQHDFLAVRVGNDDNLRAMKDWFDKTGKLFDPHSTIALRALENHCDAGGEESESPWLALATADARKFSVAIDRAGMPQPPLSDDLKTMLAMPEKLTILDNDIQSVAQYLAGNLV
ncbi:MAG: threonine synthase [Hydrotalea sp.]|nr:threonine synthase [Hydrotalea sp.]